MQPIPVIDLFAGPGGLNEGFSARERYGHEVFRTVASFEKDRPAVETLRLRTALRHVVRETGSLPRPYRQFLSGTLTRSDLDSSPQTQQAMKQASEEVHDLTLGTDTRHDSDAIIERALATALAHESGWVLIGGPPCQAYSLAGRSRMKGTASFATDERHTLYREYLHIITKFRPTVFVMENVKGMLSSQHNGGRIFETILRDLRGGDGPAGYDVYSFVAPGLEDLEPTDFIIRSELYGVPQNRHRVILLGVRRDAGLGIPRQLSPSPQKTVEDAIGDLPQIRSRVRPATRDEAWETVRNHTLLEARYPLPPLETGNRSNRRVPRIPDLGRRYIGAYAGPRSRDPLMKWIRKDTTPGVTLHEGRGHMEEDLKRYAFLAAMAKIEKRSLRVTELPESLLPKHRNVSGTTIPFADRFRVQQSHLPSSTVVSHIAKDGHYYIHPDPWQMRSLTVREAARLQTFPDNYYFMGTRTQQYHQVGNAVPPLLAYQLAEIVAELLQA